MTLFAPSALNPDGTLPIIISSRSSTYQAQASRLLRSTPGVAVKTQLPIVGGCTADINPTDFDRLRQHLPLGTTVTVDSYRPYLDNTLDPAISSPIFQPTHNAVPAATAAPQATPSTERATQATPAAPYPAQAPLSGEPLHVDQPTVLGAPKAPTPVQDLGADQVWSQGFRGQGIGVAILDTGIYPHLDLKERIVAFKDFVNNQTAPYDDHGHGTHVAGDCAGNGKASGGHYMGTAPQANLIGIKVMDAHHGGRPSTIIEGIQWAV
jgi:subtilisin family serine protease